MFFSKKQSKKERYYFDFAAASPMDPEVISVLEKVSSSVYGNPGALHQEGLLAKQLLEESREKVAQFFTVHKDELVFTSGGTESAVLAIRGVIDQAVKTSESKKKPHVVSSNIEHPAVKDTLESLEKDGKISLSFLSVNKEGVVDVQELKNLVTKETVLVCVMYVNNETGAIQGIPSISKEVRRLRKKFHGDRHVGYPLVYTDASQALLTEDVQVSRLGVDLLTCNAGKIYGPKGVGALFVKRGILLEPVLYSGGQERGLRPGTEPVPLIAGFARALELISSEESRYKDKEYLNELRQFFLEGLHERASHSALSKLGFEYAINSEHVSVPHIVSVSVKGLESDQLVIELDARGVAVSAKSACKTSDPQTSHVLRAIGYEDNSWGTVRFSFATSVTKDDITYALNAFQDVCIKLLHTKKEFNL